VCELSCRHEGGREEEGREGRRRRYTGHISKCSSKFFDFISLPLTARQTKTQLVHYKAHGRPHIQENNKVGALCLCHVRALSNM
jgi:hypothetical protein